MGWKAKDVPDQSGKHIIVTGSNSGIGFEAADVLAAKGAHVTLACRNADKAKEAQAKIKKANKGATVETGSLDLASLKSIAAFAADYSKKHGKLDILINNAGVMVPPYGKTEDGFELQIGCNHLGHFALTAQLIDLINAAPEGRVVSVASQAHRGGKINFDDLHWEKGYQQWPAYGQSKLANLLFTYELDRNLKEAGHTTRATAAHPGYSSTNLQRTMTAGTIANALFAQSQKAGALPTLRAATDPDAESGSYWGPNGIMEMRGHPVKVKSNRRSHDKRVARRLWDTSQELTGQTFAV
ncbi:oxidoreductase [Pyruvatibacter sp.]|uniref:oxidoreductase n=1 Tax=Pyruvatibacter sp. TaxID=1981328 RepID=UPI00326614F2